jgi:polo-like kinase 1
MTGRIKKPIQGLIDLQQVEEVIKKPNNDIAIRTYSKGKFLGKGGFASVFEFTNSDTKQVFASKIINKTSLTKSRLHQKLKSEIKIHRSLIHPHIVKFEHCFEDSENVYILLELCTNQSLSELLRRRKRLTEIEAKCYLNQLISALKYLHSNKIIHRDIKLGNIFLNEKLELKLGDFGLASKLEFEGERKRTICGTPNYIAPEILEGNNGHSYEVDVWSFGVLAYTLMVGKAPFETNDIKETYKRIKMNAYGFPDYVELSKDAKDMIMQILVLDPAVRPGLEEIQGFMFFTRNAIPKAMPLSSLAVPPSANFVSNFQVCDENRPQTARTKSKSKENQVFLNETQKIVEIKEGLDNAERLETAPKEKSPIGKNRKIMAASCYTPLENGPDVWVKKWVDYSSKYGVGYQLSNYCVGVFFNDSSKLISDPSGQTYKFQDKNSSEEITFVIDSCPMEYKKKVSLVEHFRTYLKADKHENHPSLPLVYVKKFINTKHAYIFRMSNKVVQVKFMDKSELLLTNATKHAMYINKALKISVHPLSSIFETASQDLSKRLRYTKEVLSNGTVVNE